MALLMEPVARMALKRRKLVAASCFANISFITDSEGDFACFRFFIAFAVFAEIIDMKAQHIFVFNSVGDGIGVQLLFEYIFGGFEGADGAVKLLVSSVIIKNRRAGKAKQLGLGERFFNGSVVIAELRAMAFVKDEYYALFS